MKRIKLKIKKGDTVQITAGADRGKQGAVLAVDPVKLKVKVQGVKVQTHYTKEDGLQKREGFFDYSNVKLVQSTKAPAEKTTKKKASSRK